MKQRLLLADNFYPQWHIQRHCVIAMSIQPPQDVVSDLAFMPTSDNFIGFATQSPTTPLYRVMLLYQSDNHRCRLRIQLDFGSRRVIALLRSLYAKSPALAKHHLYVHNLLRELRKFRSSGTNVSGRRRIPLLNHVLRISLGNSGQIKRVILDFRAQILRHCRLSNA